MCRNVSPADVLFMRPEQLDKIKPQTEMDAALIESLQWGYAFHPKEAQRARGVAVDEEVTIDWSCPQPYEDVQVAIREATVLADIPIAGLAEHLVGLRRLVNAQPIQVRSGESWRYGTTAHLATLFGQD